MDNNIAESFNVWIKDARFKTIVSMLDDIRLQVMNRIAKNRNQASKWVNDWSLSCMALFQEYKEKALGYEVFFNGEVGFEIGEGEDKHSIFYGQKVMHL